jgi:hypothetical protein
MVKKKIRKRKRKFNLQTEEGRQLALNNIKLFSIFPEKKERTNYLTAMIEEFDRLIGLTNG